MSDNDLIRRGDAIALTCDPFGAETVTSQAINAIPAAQPTVKPGEIERAVWGAMGWALRHAKQMPGDIIPSYTDTGNSDAEVECRRSAARILSALDMQPTVSPDVAELPPSIVVRDAVRTKGHIAIRNLDQDDNDLGICIIPREHIDGLIAALARVKGVM